MRFAGVSRAILFSLLRCFALLVRSSDRENWFAEWKGELSYVLLRRHGRPALLFAFGSLQDAVWLGWDRVQTMTAKRLRSPSWIICLGELLALSAFTYVCSGLEPGFTQAPFADQYDVRVDASLCHAALQIFMALATLPAITSLDPGRYPRDFSPGARVRETAFWLFLVSKALMVIWTCHFVGLAVTHLAESAAILSNLPEIYRAIRDGLTPLQFLITFASCLYGLRWVLEDQRRRCPVCLHYLGALQTHGGRVRIFLGKSRSEKFCVNGHGSLIVPDFQTSWLAPHLWELPNESLRIAER